MPREDEVRQARHFQTCSGDSTRFKRINFFEECGEVNDNSVANHWRDGVIEDATGRQLQSVFLVANNNCVTRIVSALIASNDAVRCGEEVNDLGLAFIAPLGTYNNGDSHERSPFGTCIDTTCSC